jgi:hypothetical protein
LDATSESLRIEYLRLQRAINDRLRHVHETKVVVARVITQSRNNLLNICSRSLRQNALCLFYDAWLLRA